MDYGKIDPEAAICPLTLEAYLEYKVFCRAMSDGSTRPDDNWQKGMPTETYMKSLWRHMLEIWKQHRGHRGDAAFPIAAAAAMFNIQGLLHNYLKENPDGMRQALALARQQRGY